MKALQWGLALLAALLVALYVMSLVVDVGHKPPSPVGDVYGPPYSDGDK